MQAFNPEKLQQAWAAAWAGLSPERPHPELGHHLLACWAEPHRHYHSLQHLEECLALFSAVSAQAQRPSEVALALWFHDAIYDLHAKDNEARSAEWAQSALLEAGVPRKSAQRVRDLVMATCHDAVPTDHDQQLLVDIDLSILGAPAARYAEYESQVRAEYSFVPEPAFRQGRKAILQKFLERPQLFNTASFLASHEQSARLNLKNSMARLCSALPPSPPDQTVS